MDVENIEALSPVELDALLDRALNPQVPVEVFYAVLERVASHGSAARAADDASPRPDGVAPAEHQGQSSQSGQQVQPGQGQGQQQQALPQQQVHPQRQQPSGRRVAQHGPPPRPMRPVTGNPSSAPSLALSSAPSSPDTEETTVMRAIAGSEDDATTVLPAQSAAPAAAQPASPARGFHPPSERTDRNEG